MNPSKDCLHCCHTDKYHISLICLCPLSDMYLDRVDETLSCTHFTLKGNEDVSEDNMNQYMIGNCLD